MSSTTYDFDYGIDLTLNEVTIHNGRPVLSGFRLDIQAKSTVLGRFDTDTINYDLNVKNYEDLRQPVPVPRILVLLALPTTEIEWMVQGEDALSVRRCAYWTSLRGASATTNRRTIAVTLQRHNVFSRQGLRWIMGRIRQGVDL
jgi:hypothetical protein